MAEAAKPEAKAGKKEKKLKKKDTLPTNCQKCNTRIRRKNWYYHHCKYFCGANCAKDDWKKIQDDKTKAKAEATSTAAPAAETPKQA